MRTLFLLFLLETESTFYMGIRATRRSGRLQGKGSAYFKTLSIGPVPEIEPTTSQLIVKKLIQTMYMLYLIFYLR